MFFKYITLGNPVVLIQFYKQILLIQPKLL